MDSQQCTLHFGAKTLLTMDNSLNYGPWTPFHGTKVHFLSLPWIVNKIFLFLWFVFFVVFLFLLYFQLNLQFCETIFLYLLYTLQLLEKVSD